MKLDKEQLLELQDYVNQLDLQVGLDADTLNDITKAIDNELDKINDSNNLIEHFNGLGSL